MLLNVPVSFEISLLSCSYKSRDI